jgi:Holliday junction resolvasome RuvABC endonuclease subunit
MGIDQSFTSTGVMILDETYTRLHHACVKTKKDIGGKVETINRATFICTEICKLVDEYNVTHVVIEELAFAATGDATRNLAGLQFMIGRALLDKGITPTFVVPSQLKKFATDNGRASKDEMVESLPEVPDNIRELVAKIPKSKGRYDLADAYWLAMWG